MSKVRESERSKAIRLLASGLSQSETSRQIGCSRQKLSLWCKKEAFQQELLEAKKKLLQTAIDSKIDDTKVDEPVASSEPKIKPLVQRVESKQQLRQKELLLLEKIESSMLPLLEEGSVRSGMLLLKVIEIRTKLLGLNQKNYQILEASEFLFGENVIPQQKIETLRSGLEQLESNLKAIP